MKNLPLAVQIWLVIGGIIFSIFLCVALFLPTILKSFFTYQIYDIINDSQNSITIMTMETNVRAELVKGIPAGVTSGVTSGITAVIPAEKFNSIEIGSAPILAGEKPISVSAIIKPAVVQSGPLVGHFVFSGNDVATPSASAIPQDFLQAVQIDANRQKSKVQEYAKEIQDKTLFYVIRKEEIQGRSGYVVSYSWANYRNDLVNSMYANLVLAMLAIFVLSWVPSLMLSRYLSRPLVQMEANIARIAKRDWHSPFILNRKDEIGKLAQSFENMRQRLVKQDQAQQSYLQNISHELKTPVMVIRSYANSILDGIYPNETVENSIEVIDQEALRLEKLVRDLLLLNKLKYLEAKDTNQDFSTFDLTEVIRNTVNRFRCRRPDIRWEINLPVLMLHGRQEEWGIMAENILDNQIKFANGLICIDLSNSASSPYTESQSASENSSYTESQSAFEFINSVVLRIFNDGQQIEQDVAETAFDTFKTGTSGDFGLGLAIVKQIVSAHQGDIWVKPEAGGTAFYIRLNLMPKAKE